MPLTNSVILGLNEITTMIEDKSRLTDDDIDRIRSIFKTLVKSGERYDVDEIECWFRNEGTWNTREPIIRIANMSGYIQDKFRQTDHLRIMQDEHDCAH